MSVAYQDIIHSISSLILKGQELVKGNCHQPIPDVDDYQYELFGEYVKLLLANVEDEHPLVFLRLEIERLYIIDPLRRKKYLKAIDALVYAYCHPAEVDEDETVDYLPEDLGV